MAIMEYINNSLPWACMPFAGGSRGSIYTIYKGLDKDAVGRIMKAVVTAAVKPPETFDAAVKAVTEVLKDQGSLYPVIFIGERDPFTSDYTSNVMIKYNGLVHLDYADPNFFDYLDQVLNHIKLNDDLSAFSLEPQNAV